MLNLWLQLGAPSGLVAGLFGLPLDSIMSTQGIMVMLLVAYAGAMWMFLKSAPKVHTIMVSDLEVARRFYEGMLNLPVADVPLHYYYNYEQTLGTAGIDPMYMSGVGSMGSQSTMTTPDGLWYQLRKKYPTPCDFRGQPGTPQPSAPCVL